MKLPDAVFVQLRHLLDQGETVQWATGDFIRDVWEEIHRYTPKIDQPKEQAQMIKDMARETGADKSTLRSRFRMSVFFTDQQRATWMPPYTYHQMRALKSAEDGWADVATWGLMGGWNGQLATIEEIRAHIRGEQDPLELTLKRIIVLERKIRVVLDDLSTPADVREGLILIPAILEDVKELL